MSETHQDPQAIQSAKQKDYNSPVWEQAIHPFPAWRKGVFVLALIVGLAGLGIRGMAGTSGAQTGGLTVSADIAKRGAEADESGAELTAAVPQGARSTASSAPTADGLPDTLQTPLGQYLEDWSGPMMQLGFSFVAGFSIGYALAFFLKATAVVLGVLLLMLFGLQYVGVVDVNWLGVQSYYDALITWAQPHAGSFREFIASNLPSSGMAALGLFTGFKRK